MGDVNRVPQLRRDVLQLADLALAILRLQLVRLRAFEVLARTDRERALIREERGRVKVALAAVEERRELAEVTGVGL